MSENKTINQYFTDEHIALIQKGITKAIKNFDFDEWIGDYLNNELDSVYSDANVSRFLEDEICEVVKQHLIKSGLLMENK